MGKIGFLFPGQGAQFVGMGQDLMALSAARARFDEANEVLGYDLAELCLSGPEEKLAATEHSQPALFVTSMAALERLRDGSPEVLPQCAMTAGLSLGEYSAMCFADVMSFGDALRVVQVRGRAMQEASDANPSGMVAVLGLEVAQVESLCDEARGDGILQVANLLCPGNTVCSGDAAACQRLAALGEEAGAMKVMRLSVAGAFHTELMESARKALTDAIERVEMRPARIPIVSNVDAQPHTDPAEIRRLVIKQLVSPVHWEASMRSMLQSGVEQFYEVGAGKVLRGLLRRIERKIPVTNV